MTSILKQPFCCFIITFGPPQLEDIVLTLGMLCSVRCVGDKAGLYSSGDWGDTGP